MGGPLTVRWNSSPSCSRHQQISPTSWPCPTSSLMRFRNVRLVWPTYLRVGVHECQSQGSRQEAELPGANWTLVCLRLLAWQARTPHADA